jgi:hypothetical protein
MITVSFFILLVTCSVYVLADYFVTHGDCEKPCRTCPHWDRCLSRRICRVQPSKDPELCILRWN